MTGIEKIELGKDYETPTRVSNRIIFRCWLNIVYYSIFLDKRRDL